ncbi:EAL domain-containing protein [Acidithiobacillus ferriphilus]|uniref:EAL domain-containing protein n=1 Tax=Acidithiobacillus ferriphilus TaxID=1689834 RepID=UPI001C06B730|nr:EAL domain-containing protein [Acidithiobacillus ferriphilus]MBU2853100.1 diguanylate cyclase [Acidithiobacillus ferriphilus]
MSSTEYPVPSVDLLASYHEFLAAGVEAFIVAFYRTLEAIPERAQVLNRLSPERYQHLRTAQARHLRLLLSPEMETSWRADAHLAGRTHYRHGVLPSWVADSYALYWRHLLAQIEQPEIAARDRHLLRSLLVARLLQDLAWQLEGYAEGSGDVRNLLLHLDHLMVGADSEAAMIPQIMDFLIREGGVDGAWFGYPDSAGKMVIMATAGAGMAEYLSTVTVSIDDTPQGQGPAGRAWRTEKVQVTPDWDSDASMRPWQEQARPFGWNSNAAIPMVDSSGRSRSVLALLSRERGFFGHPDQQMILAHLAVVLGLALERLHLIAEETVHRETLERLNTLYHALMAEGDILLRARNERDLFRETCRRLAISDLFSAAWVGHPNEEGVIKCLVTAGRGAQAFDSIHLSVADTPEGQSLAARAWRSGRLHFSNDYLADPSLASLNDLFLRHRWRASAAIPIYRQGVIWGILVVVTDRTGVFDEAILGLLARIARLLSHGLDEIDLRARLDAVHGQQAWLADHDPLTGLPNRAALSPRLLDAMARALRHERIMAIGMLDLDNFKPINDQYGHAAGDVLLTTFADRLQGALRQTDFVARLGGDEFVLVFEDLKNMDDLESVLARIQEAIEAPFMLPGGDSVIVGGSLGLTFYPFDDGDPDQLLRHADQALYTIKEAKRNRERFWTYYHANTDTDVTALRQSMSTLFAAGGLRVHYQPVIDLENGQGAGEILAPARFLSFLSVDERRALTRAVLAQAVQDVATWEAAGFPLSVSVNVEPELLTHDACLHCLTEIIGPSGIDPGRITLEILENGDFLSIASARQRLLEIKATGVRLALDDVGSAYSSLLRLKELPIDKIKLDQSFVRELARRPDNLHFVHSLLGLAQGLGVGFVAEGAETPEILDALSALGVSQAQGYAIACPMPAAEMLSWLRAYTPAPYHGPKSLLGLYACHLRFSDTMKTLLMQVPMVSAAILAELAAVSPVSGHVASLGLGISPIAQAYFRYQEAMAAISVDMVAKKPNLTMIDEASALFLECIREALGG